MVSAWCQHGVSMGSAASCSDRGFAWNLYIQWGLTFCIQHWIRDVFRLRPFGPGTKGNGILCAQDKCPSMNQHPLWRPLVHGMALVMGKRMAKPISNPDVAPLSWAKGWQNPSQIQMLRHVRKHVMSDAVMCEDVPCSWPRVLAWNRPYPGRS